MPRPGTSPVDHLQGDLQSELLPFEPLQPLLVKINNAGELCNVAGKCANG